MMPTSILLFYEFFKTGLFTFGGGLASIPFLYHICHNYNWFSEIELTQLIAISNLTPGPIGLNMATFSGFKTLGITGAIIASFAMVLPMIIVTSQVFKLYKKFSENRYVQTILYFLRPTSCALIVFVGIKLAYNQIFYNQISINSVDFKALLVLAFLFILTFKLPKNPIYYLLIAGCFGVIFYFLGYIN